MNGSKPALRNTLACMVIGPLILTGCSMSMSYSDTHKAALEDIPTEDATADTILEELLSLTYINLNSEEREEMLDHIAAKSPGRRHMILAHLKTASGAEIGIFHSIFVGSYIYIGWTDLDYPVPDGVTKVQYLQHLMTTSTAGVTP